MDESKINSNPPANVIIPLERTESDDNPLDLTDEFRDLQKWLKNDNAQYIYIGLQGFVEGFKILMASLLAITVVQKCEGKTDNICSFQDAFNRDKLTSAAIGINVLNILIFIIFYIIELSREVYLIRYLDIDKHKSDLHLPNVIAKYPKINKGLIKHNNRYNKSIVVLCFVTGGNWIISIVVIGMNWYSIKTLLSLLTNMLLITTKIMNARTISKESLRKNIAISAFMKEFTSFNTIDADYR